MRFPIVELFVISCIGGVFYFLANRAPFLGPTIKPLVKWGILAVTCLVLLDVVTGSHYLPALR